MGAKSNIEWTDATWNPVTGCSKVSPGCQNCYAETMAKRLQGMQPNGRYRNGFKVTVHDTDSVMGIPLRKKTPTVYFVNSMSDLFHGDIPNEVIQRIMLIMREAHWHIFQVLTKRPKRMMEFSHKYPIPPNVWMGTSIEDETRARQRIFLLRETKCTTRFVSAEPLLGHITTDISKGIDWVIVGGESGPNARPMKYSWATAIRDQCHDNRTPFFFKQWGEFNTLGERVGKKAAGRILDGQLHDDMPDHYAVWFTAKAL